MNIIYICGDNLKENRGYTTHIVEIVTNLQRWGAKITLYTPFSADSHDNLNAKVMRVPTIGRNVA